jgi:hypothetical protein
MVALTLALGEVKEPSDAVTVTVTTSPSSPLPRMERS